MPISNLAALIERSKVVLDKSWLPCPIVAHAGDGNFHVCIMINKDSARDREEARRLSEYMVKLYVFFGVPCKPLTIPCLDSTEPVINVHLFFPLRALEMDGTCTGEHGVGTGKAS